MKQLLQNILIADPASPWNNKHVDILISGSSIESVAGTGSIKADNHTVINCEGCTGMPGWFDLRANFREPGEEQKETIRSGQDAAAAGGFTGVLLMPSTNPPVHNRSVIESVYSKANGHKVKVYQSGCITENRNGNDLAEMYDMMQGGAVAFTDDKRTIAKSGVMLRAMQYAGNIGARLIAYLDEKSLSGNNNANESANTTMLGFKGSPAIAEVIALERDLNLVRYSGMPLHFSGISTAAAVEGIRKAKAEGLPVTADVYLHHLVFDDSSLQTFDANYKVKPPLRNSSDRESLKAAVLDGTIDVICSDHSPEDYESKVLEYDAAAFGMTALETFYPVLMHAFGDALSLHKMYELLVLNPRKILGLPVPVINTGETVNLTVFNSAVSWTYTAKNGFSKSHNSPFDGQEMQGKVLGIFRG